MLFECRACKETYPGTGEYFSQGAIRFATDKGKSFIPKCKICASTYQLEYRANLRARKLSSTGRPIPYRRVGTIYIIGTNDRSIPCKIGMTIGADVRNRLSSIQTCNWMELKILYKSPLVVNIDKVEAKILESLRSKRVRGEWHLLSQRDLKNFEKLLTSHADVLL
jgi:hypothetical protein